MRICHVCTVHTWAEVPPDPLRVLDACARRATYEGLPQPAALLGDWLGAAAVIAPSVDLLPVAPEHAFGDGSASADGGGLVVVAPSPSPALAADPRYTLGFRSFPDVPAGARRLLPEAVSGRTDGLLVLGHDGRWTARGDVPTPRDLGLGRSDDDDATDTATNTVTDTDTDTDTIAASDAAAAGLTWEAPDRRSHQASVRECLETIRAGEIYQACLSTRLVGRLHGEPLALFSRLWRQTRARRAAFMTGSWGSVVSLSPETYLTRSGREVRSRPIKGTLPRTADPALLRASVKDVAENIMIVDLVRHDLGRTAELGSVTVPELLTVHEAPGVWHLVSTVAARACVPHDELVETTFPPASVTGTPKLRARGLIAGWEPRARGLHCGAIGIAGPDELDLSVAIRTLEIAPDGRCEFGVGGGITIDSDPDAEWDECVHKAAFTWGGGPAPW